MPAQKGKDLLIKISDGGTGFVTVAGLRTRQISFNAETVDVTHAESAGRWRELLAGVGVRRAGITGSGVFKDESSDARMRQVFFDGDILTYQIIVSGASRGRSKSPASNIAAIMRARSRSRWPSNPPAP